MRAEDGHPGAGDAGGGDPPAKDEPSWAPAGYRIIRTLTPAGPGGPSFLADRGGEPWVLRRLPAAAGAGVDEALEGVAHRLSGQEAVVTPRPLAITGSTLVVGRPWVGGVPFDGAWLESVPPLDRPGLTAAVAADLAAVIGAVHDAQCVHGSLTASNVIVGPQGVKLVDCGLLPALSGADPASGHDAAPLRLGDLEALARITAAVGATPPASTGARNLRRRRLRISGAEPSPHGSDRPRRVRRFSAAAAGVGLIVCVLLLCTRAPHRTRAAGGAVAAGRMAAVANVLVTPGEAVVVTGPGTGYRVHPQRDGDVLIRGAWFCAGADPALYRPSTGEVFEFGAWPAAGRTVRSRRTVATGVVDGHPGAARDGRGCDVPIVRP